MFLGFVLCFSLGVCSLSLSLSLFCFVVKEVAVKGSLCCSYFEREREREIMDGVVVVLGVLLLLLCM